MRSSGMFERALMSAPGFGAKVRFRVSLKSESGAGVFKTNTNPLLAIL